MNELAYSGVNTTVRILEQELLTPDEWTTLVQASSLTQALEQLQKSPYDIHVQELAESKQFDAVLLQQLTMKYQELYELIPTPELLDVFSIRYTYHNLKVLLKEKFAEKNFQDLLVPIGRYKMDTLRQLVETRESTDVPSIMEEAVREAWTDFENFGRLETADIFMDTYYFKHLRYLDNVIGEEKIHDIIMVMIDLENISTLIRANKQKQSRSFLQTVLSNVGSVEKTKLIDTVQEQGWNSLVELFDHVSYKDELAAIVSEENVSVLQIELLKDKLIYEALKDATFDAFGPYPSLAYIHASEMEVRNLRLLLVGLDNEFAPEQLIERMRPVYGS